MAHIQPRFCPVPPVIMSQLPNTLQPVERAIGDLRRGATIVLRADDHALLVQAAEGTTSADLARISSLSKSTPALLLTARRAALLSLTEQTEGAVRLSLAGGITADTVRMMADPASPQSDPAPAPVSISDINPSTLPGAAETGAIELLKLACLLPAAVVAPVPDERLEYLSAWAENQALLTVELDHVRNYQEIEARTLVRVGKARVPLEVDEDVEIVAFRPTDGGREHLAIVIGSPDPAQPVLVGYIRNVSLAIFWAACAVTAATSCAGRLRKSAHRVEALFSISLRKAAVSVWSTNYELICFRMRASTRSMPTSSSGSSR